VSRPVNANSGHKFKVPNLSISRHGDDFVLEFCGHHSGIVRFHLSRPLEGHDPLGWHLSSNCGEFWPGCDPWSFSMMLGSMVLSSMSAQSKFDIPEWKKPFLYKVVASKLIRYIRPMVPLMSHELLPYLPMMQKHLKFLNWRSRSFSFSAAVALAYAVTHKDDIRLSLMLSRCVTHVKSEDGFRWVGGYSRIYRQVGGYSRILFHDTSPSELLHSMIGDDAEYLIEIIAKSTRRTHPVPADWIERHFKFDHCELCHDEANMFILGATHDVSPCMWCVKNDPKAYAHGVRMLLKKAGNSSKTTKLFSAHSCINNCVLSTYDEGIGLKCLY